MIPQAKANGLKLDSSLQDSRIGTIMPDPYDDISYEEKMAKIKEIRQGRIMPSKKKAASPKQISAKKGKLKKALEGLTEEQRLALIKQLSGNN